MATPKKYIHDRVVLLLLTVNTFLGVGASLVVLLRLLGSHATGYIVQYRSSLGLSGFKTGAISSLYSFIGFLLLVTVIGIVLSYRAYPIRRHLAIAFLGFTLILLLYAIVVSGALLNLR